MPNLSDLYPAGAAEAMAELKAKKLALIRTYTPHKDTLPLALPKKACCRAAVEVDRAYRDEVIFVCPGRWKSRGDIERQRKWFAMQDEGEGE